MRIGIGSCPAWVAATTGSRDGGKPVAGVANAAGCGNSCVKLYDSDGGGDEDSRLSMSLSIYFHLSPGRKYITPYKDES